MSHQASADGRGPTQRLEASHAEHRSVWPYAVVILLGFWLVTSPFTFGYLVSEVAPAPLGSHISPRLRIDGMIVSDLLSGLSLIVLAGLCLGPPRAALRWAICLVGVWLNAAPLVFWAPSPVAYLNDTLTGILVIAFVVLVPGSFHAEIRASRERLIPPGWSYNPSCWPQRSVMIALAFAGWLVSRYLAAYQLGYLSHLVDPFFGAGSETVVTSNVSAAWPVSDAGLGAFAYTLEMLMGFMGGQARWRTMPWLASLFGLFVIPIAIFHVALVISQPLVVNGWCTSCLLAALLMLPLIPLTIDEVIAAAQFVGGARARGVPAWQAFWLGDPPRHDVAEPSVVTLSATPRRPASLAHLATDAVRGLSVPWTLAVAAAFGVWLLFAPWVFASSGLAETSSIVSGTLIVAVAVTTMAEPLRVGRFVLTAIGIWLIVSQWTIRGHTSGAIMNLVFVGTLLVLLSLPRGMVREHFGSWDRYVM